MKDSSEPPRIQLSEFKAKCLAIIAEIARTGRPIVVTKHGQPLVQVGHYINQSAKRDFLSMCGTGKVLSDIVNNDFSNDHEALDNE